VTIFDIEDVAEEVGIASLYQGIVVVAIAIAPVAVALALVYRRRIARLDVAAGLVLWGLLIVVIEHGSFGLAGFGGADLLRHTGLHFQMLAAYGLAAFALVGVVVAPLVRRGDAAGWFGLLVLFAIGVGAEVATAAVTTPHGVPPRFWIAGLFLWGYPLAWGAALALSFNPILRPEGRPTVSVPGEDPPRAELSANNRDDTHPDRGQPTGEEKKPAT